MVCVREREKPCARNVAVGMYTLGLGENKDSEQVRNVAVGMYTLGLGENKDSEQVRTFR
jgi:hypothetical protein